MFDFGWSEIALIGVVALVLIGPKDLPIAIRAVTDVIKKMRRMAGELQGHVDEMLREADLKEAHDTFRDLRGGGLRDRMFRAIDGDGTIRKTLDSNPLPKDDILGLRTGRGTAADAGLGRPAIARGEGGIAMSGPLPAAMALTPGASATAAPSFIPPATSGEGAAATGRIFPAPPAFIPPAARKPAEGAESGAMAGDVARDAVAGEVGRDALAGDGRETG